MRKMSKFAMKSEEKALKKLKSCDINNRKFEFRKKVRLEFNSIKKSKKSKIRNKRREKIRKYIILPIQQI